MTEYIPIIRTNQREKKQLGHKYVYHQQIVKTKKRLQMRAPDKRIKHIILDISVNKQLQTQSDHRKVKQKMRKNTISTRKTNKIQKGRLMSLKKNL